MHFADQSGVLVLIRLPVSCDESGHAYMLGILPDVRHWWWWWCGPHPVHEHAQDLRPPLRARPASPPTRQAAQPPPRGPSTNPRPLDIGLPFTHNFISYS